MITRHAAALAHGAALALGIVLLWPAGARANDTMAVFGAGGLQFEQTDKVRMEREELYLSPREVRVSYVFRNLTDSDVRGRVAFPMPQIDVGGMSESPHKFHTSNRDGDIFDFQVEVDGRPASAEYEVHAFIKEADGTERDVTDLLRKHRVSLVDPDHVRMAADVARELVASGVVEDDEVHHPRWFVKAAYHWMQVFPARREVRITHRYKPVLGGSWRNVELDPEPSAKSARGPVGEYCEDEAFDRAVRKLPRPKHDPTVVTYWLKYILKTGANWAGPIGTFRLEIDKAGADLVSLCPIPGLKLERRGVTFVGEAKRYTPTSDLKLLFVYRPHDSSQAGDMARFPHRD